jgi:hypothetical protein
LRVIPAEVPADDEFLHWVSWNFWELLRILIDLESSKQASSEGFEESLEAAERKTVLSRLEIGAELLEAPRG